MSTGGFDIFDLPALREGDDVEFKSAKGGLPKSLWETYSAFANTNGGTIYLGVVERPGDRVEIQGLEDVDKLLTDFWNKVNNRQVVSHNLLRSEYVTIIPFEGKTIVEIRVPRAERTERPVYVGQNPFNGTYRRNREGDYRCTEAEVRRMFADQDREETADMRILPEFTWDDLDRESITQYRNVFRSAYEDHAWLGLDDRELLEKLGGFRKDRRTGESGITVAGLLMFGKTEAIQAPEAIPGFYLDYRERFSDDPNERWSDRVHIDHTWEANLFQFYRRVILKLHSGPGITRPFQTDEQGYRRSTTQVHEALQEALVNALIHADHFGQGGIVIDRYVDRIVFSNPGTLLVSREQLLQGGISECRNKALQRMFQMLGVGDRAGSGIDKIRASWKAQHWQSPRLRETQRPDRVQLELPMVSTLPAEVTERLEARFGEEYRRLSPEEIQALVAAEVDGVTTNQRLQEMLSMHRVDITEMLRGLVKRGFLSRQGFGRGTRYVPVTGPTGCGGPRQVEIPLELELRSPNLGTRSPNLGTRSPNLGTRSPNLGARLPNTDESTSHCEAEADGEQASSTGVDEELLRLAEPARRGRKVSEEAMRQMLLAICEKRFFTLRELSDLLCRKQKTLRDIYIRPLVLEGLLEPRYPYNPNHPEQAYRTRSFSKAH